MDKFAKLWPDTLSTSEALRDLDYEPDVTLPAMIANVLTTHSGRRLTSKAAFRSPPPVPLSLFLALFIFLFVSASLAL